MATEHHQANLATRLLLEAARTRFFTKVVQDGECLRWTGAADNDGYGNFHIGSRHAQRTIKAHRASFILAHGDIPANALLLHSCDHPWCVNPAHLHPGTHGQNRLEAYERGLLVNQNSRKTQCIRGHAFTLENTRTTGRSRHCRRCEQLRPRRRAVA